MLEIWYECVYGLKDDVARFWGQRSRPLLGYLRNRLTYMLEIWYECAYGLKHEVVRFWGQRSKVTAISGISQEPLDVRA